MEAEKRRICIKLPDRTGALVMFIVALFTVGFLISSPLAVGIHGRSGVDSSVFRYIGKGLAEGKVMYRDMFDHKGPLLYLINYVGYRIHSEWGIWIIELTNLAVTLGFSYFTVKKILENRILSILVTILSYRLMLNYFDYGNLVEEYSMSFLAIGLYLFCWFFIEGGMKAWKVMICGACCACVCLLRPNGAGIWVIFVPAVLICLCAQKRWKELGTDICAFLLGIILVILPFVIYFLINGIFREFWECYILFNFQYTGNSKRDMVNALCILFGTEYIPGILFIACCLLFVKWDESFGPKSFLVVNLINVFFNLLISSMSGRAYGHYGMTALPSLCLMNGVVAGFFARQCKSWKMEERWSCAIVFLGTVLFLSNMEWMPKLTRNLGEYFQNLGRPAEISEVAQVIRDHTSPEDEILVWGNNCHVYLEADRRGACRLFYQSSLAEVDPAFLEEAYQEINEDKPKLFVISTNHLDTLNWDSILVEYEYITQSEGYDVYKIKE